MKKLYKVTCNGMHSSSTGCAYGIGYVIASNPDGAYTKVRKYLDEKEIGFERDRVLQCVELIAESGEYPECGFRLYL